MFIDLFLLDAFTCVMLLSSETGHANHYHCDNEPSHVPLVLSCSVTYMYMSVSLIFSSTNVGCSGQSEWKLLSVTPFSQLGSEERLSFKKILMIVQKGQEERVQQAGEAAVKMQAKSEAVEHHMTAGSIVATCLSIANTWSDL